MSECKHRGTKVTADEQGFLCFDCGDFWDALSMLERAEKAESQVRELEVKLEQGHHEQVDFLSWLYDQKLLMGNPSVLFETWKKAKEKGE